MKLLTLQLNLLRIFAIPVKVEMFFKKDCFIIKCLSVIIAAALLNFSVVLICFNVSRIVKNLHVLFRKFNYIRVRTRTENLQKWEGIFQSEKSEGNLNGLEKSENHTKYSKTLGISDKCYLLFSGDI